jgi:phage portal protein BeeE
MDLKFWRKTEQRDISAPVAATPVAGDSFLQLLNATGVKLPTVTVASALTVPAVLAAVSFLSRTLATLDLDAYRQTKTGPEAVGGRLQTIIRDAPNPEMSGHAARKYFWQSVFTQGRGLQIIVRDDRGQPFELWSVDPSAYRVTIDSLGRKSYTDPDGKVYPCSVLPAGGSDIGPLANRTWQAGYPVIDSDDKLRINLLRRWWLAAIGR